MADTVTGLVYQPEQVQALLSMQAAAAALTEDVAMLLGWAAHRWCWLAVPAAAAAARWLLGGLPVTVSTKGQQQHQGVMIGVQLP
jgi:hypothetical protein